MWDDDRSAFVPGLALRGTVGTAPEGELLRKFYLTDGLTFKSKLS